MVTYHWGWWCGSLPSFTKITHSLYFNERKNEHSTLSFTNLEPPLFTRSQRLSSWFVPFISFNCKECTNLMEWNTNQKDRAKDPNLVHFVHSLHYFTNELIWYFWVLGILVRSSLIPPIIPSVPIQPTQDLDYRKGLWGAERGEGGPCGVLLYLFNAAMKENIHTSNHL